MVKLKTDSPKNDGKKGSANSGKFPSTFAPAGAKGLSKKAGGELRLQPTLTGGKSTGNSGPMFFILVGDKNSGKSTGPVGVPRPYGGKTYIISFDRATVPSLVKYFTPEQLENVVVFDVASKQYDDDGEVIYEGFDPNVPETAVKVVGTTMQILEQIEEAGDCDNLILDHFQELHENIGISYIIGEQNFDPLADLQWNHYSIRTRATKLIEAKARNIPKHTFWITGYGEEEKWDTEEYYDRNGKKKNRPVKVIKEARWHQPYQKPYHVTLKTSFSMSGDDDGGFEKNHWVEVIGSKIPKFPEGLRLNWTGTHFGVFWEREEEAEELLKEE